MADDNKPREKSTRRRDEPWGLYRAEVSSCSEGEAAGENIGGWEQGTPFPPVLQIQWGEAVRLTERLNGEVPTSGWSHHAQPQPASPAAAVMLPSLDAA